MKKAILFLLATACTACVFAGCGTDTAQSTVSQETVSEAVSSDTTVSEPESMPEEAPAEESSAGTFGGSTRRRNHHTNCRSTARLQLQYANNRRPLCRLGSVPYKQSHNTGTGHGKRICGVSQRTILSISVLFQDAVQSESGTVKDVSPETESKSTDLPQRIKASATVCS